MICTGNGCNVSGGNNDCGDCKCEGEGGSIFLVIILVVLVILILIGIVVGLLIFLYLSYKIISRRYRILERNDVIKRVKLLNLE